MRVLLTRPEADADRTAERLAAFGHEAVIAPVLSISPTGAPLPPGPLDGLVATSANAQLAFADGLPGGWADLPLYVVGERTAEPFRALGFAQIHAADGDAASLATLIRERAAPGSRLLYLAGTDRKPTLEGALIDAGFPLSVIETYRAEAAGALPEAAAAALRAGTLDAVLHYSRRSAEILFALAGHERLGDALGAVRQLCLSDDVARTVRILGGDRVETAPTPHEASLLALLDANPVPTIAEGTGCEDASGAAINDQQGGFDEAVTAERSIMSDTDSQRGGGARKRGGARRAPEVLDLSADTVAGSDSAPPAESVVAADAPAPDFRVEDSAAAHDSLAESPVSDPAPGAAPVEEPPPAADAEIAPPRTTSVPPTGRPEPSRRVEQPGGFVRPAAAGFLGGVLGAGVVALGLLLWSGAGDMGERLAALETGVGEKATRRTVEALDKRVSGNETALQALRGDLDGLGRRLPADPSAALAQLTERLDRVESGVNTLESRPAPAPVAPPPPPPPVPALGARESAGLTVAWLVRDNLNRAQPFARELNALKAVKADPAAVSALEPFAEKGAPTVSQLSAQFAPLAESLAKPPPPPPEGGVWDRMQARITGLYKVRPLGEASGDDPAAIAARADAALRRSALAEAVAELEKLPADGKASVKSFLDLAQARLAAGRAADALVAAAADQVLAATQSGGAAR